MYPCRGGLPEGLSEDRVRSVIGMEVPDRPHLDHKQRIAFAALGDSPLQSPQVFGSPLRRCVRESADAVFFQCYPLNLQLTLLSVLLEREIKP